jgi:hypothetical protein
MSKSNRRVVVGFSGGVTSAWCAGWALRNFPREEVVLLFHDTKAEDQDTYRFLHEMAAKLELPITERSDGRSLDEVFEDHNAMASDRMPFCSKELKIDQGDKYIHELQDSGVEEIVIVRGFSAKESSRIQMATVLGWKLSTLFCPVSYRFPMVEENMTKQQCADWCACTMGIPIPRMYAWSEHANCVGCVKGGKTYWLAVKENAPEIFEHRKAQEKMYGHQMFSGYVSLEDLEKSGLKRKVGHRESIEIGTCECGS